VLPYHLKMKDRISSAMFSLSGLSLLIGALGFLSGIVQLFVDVNTQVSVKWLLFTVWISITVIVVLLKVVFDLNNEKLAAPASEVPFKYDKESGILLIRRNEHFINNIVVGCYVEKNDIESLAALGYVHLVQENFIQIKLREMSAINRDNLNSNSSLGRFVIRPVVPMDALSELANANE
jgi:hypothetical protein